MALTKYEALERCSAIWGENGYTLSYGQDGTVLCHNDSEAHSIDGNGHPICHKSCQALETKAYDIELIY